MATKVLALLRSVDSCAVLLKNDALIRRLSWLLVQLVHAFGVPEAGASRVAIADQAVLTTPTGADLRVHRAVEDGFSNFMGDTFKGDVSLRRMVDELVVVRAEGGPESI